jgi:hypothetical protein
MKLVRGWLATPHPIESQLNSSEQASLKLRPAGVVKMTTSVNATNFIPGNQVTGSLQNVQMAVWANPGFVFFSISSGGRLNHIDDASFALGATRSEAIRSYVQFLWLFTLRAFRAIRTRH